MIKVSKRGAINAQLELMPTRAAILLVLVALLMGSLFHYAATDQPWLFVTAAVIDLAAVLGFAIFGPNVW